ncbi:MSP-domain protein 5 [Aphelenchoides avenae]|nr:MSP-domain protein 5 [Aphelenchus avenae]
MASLVNSIATISGITSLAVLPVLFVSAAVFVGCGKKRPPKLARNAKKSRSRKEALHESGTSIKRTPIAIADSSTADSPKAMTPLQTVLYDKTQSFSIEECPIHIPPKEAAQVKATTQVQETQVLEAPKIELIPQKKANAALPPKHEPAPTSIRTIAIVERPYDVSGGSFKVAPEYLRYAQTGGVQSVTIENQSGARQAVKVKCTDNMLYRVHPVYAFVETGQQLKVEVQRQNGSAKVDKLIFVATPASSTAASAESMFQANRKYPSTVVPLLAVPFA